MKTGTNLNKLGLCAFALVLGGQVSAQTITPNDTAEGDALIEALTNLESGTVQKGKTTVRAVSVPSIPSAIISGHGTVFMSATLANPRGGIKGNGNDADAAVGVAFGSADDGIGVQVTANITGTQPFAADGYMTIDASTRINSFASPTYIGLTASNLLGWGGSANNRETASIQMSQIIENNVPIMWTVGVGTGVRDDKPVDDRFGGFAGVGFGVADGLSLGVSSNFDKVNIGATYRPAALPGLSVSLTQTDVAGRRGEPVTSLTIGYSFIAF